MDLLLIIITIIIIMGIAYVLSRPFTHPQPALEPPWETQDSQQQYESLLREIKTLQDECENFNAPEELCRQIKVKKQQAADLLRRINDPVLDPFPPEAVEKRKDPEETQPESPFLHANTYVCPHCGRRVASSDKFCTHCGNRLQP